jgi:hypothetical protein
MAKTGRISFPRTGEQGDLLFVNEKEAAGWLRSRGLQLPKENAIGDLTDITVPQGADVFNPSISTAGQKDSLCFTTNRPIAAQRGRRC